MSGKEHPAEPTNAPIVTWVDENWLCSRSLFHFLQDYQKSFGAFYFFISLAHHADEARESAIKTLFETARSEEERAKYQRDLATVGLALKKLREYRYYNSRSITSSVVDGFLTYLSNALQSVMQKRPEILKSSEQMKIQEILEFTSFRDLIEYLVDRKINRLSYGGIPKIEEFILDTLGLTLFESEEYRRQLRYFVEVRNIHAHSRGHVNRLFLDRTEGLEFRRPEVGEILFLEYDDLVTNCEASLAVAKDIDRRLCDKFGIQRKRFKTWKRV